MSLEKSEFTLSRRALLTGATTAMVASGISSRALAHTCSTDKSIAHEAHPKLPFPPFSRQDALKKVRGAEDGWNSRNPQKVSLAYTPDSEWRNRSEFIYGRSDIIDFLTRKWNKELDYRLIKELWAFNENQIAVRFAYEYRNDSDNWFRAYGNENWEFAENGLMQKRFACINDYDIEETDRKFHWPQGRRPDDHPSLSELGL